MLLATMYMRTERYLNSRCAYDDRISTCNANKATVGTFFSVRYPKKAMRSFGVFISKIDWSKSASLNQMFLPFQCLGEDKPL